MNNQEKEIIKEEGQILAEEKNVLKEIKQEKKIILGMEKGMFMGVILGALVLAAAAGGSVYYRAVSNQVYIEKAYIDAPIINLSAQDVAAGTLEEVYVNEGDTVSADAKVARIGNDLIKTKVAGVITSVQKNLGKMFSRGETVVAMIDPTELRVIGRVEENKGLQYMRVGQQAMFTVDAFDSKKFFGTVDEISPVSRSTDVVFNISDKREVKEFNVKIRFNTTEYSELKNGMSAKIWVYKN